MTEKTLISIRLDSDIVEFFDRLALEGRYWSRSALINEVLQYVLHAATKEDIICMVRTFPKRDADFKNIIHES